VVAYTTVQVEIQDLLLDEQNPRFIIPPNADQTSIIQYLVEHEDVIDLAKEIVEYGGLMPGERIIVVKYDRHYVVLEGNRRVCASKLLRDRSLIPQPYKQRFPVANETTKNSLAVFDVDLMPNRGATQSALYNRHLKGVKSWSPISKMKFFANEFESGLDISDISSMTATSEGAVRKGIREYKLVTNTLGLSNWTKSERGSLNLSALKLSPFLRVFSAKSKQYGETGATLLKMTYDETTLRPTSTLNKKTFDEAVYIIAKNAFFNSQFNTRNHVEDIPELVELLGLPTSSVSGSSTTSGGNPTPNSNEADAGTTSKPGNTEVKRADRERDEASDATSRSSTPDNSGTERTQGSGAGPNPKPSAFFDTLTWHGLNTKKASDIGLMMLASEIQKLSTTKTYGKYPLATAMLLRALLEQSLKHHLKYLKEWENLLKHAGKQKGHDPMLAAIINFYRSKNNYVKFFVDRGVQSAFVGGTTDDVINLLDTNVHNTSYARATKEELDRIAAKGLFPLIQHILNLK